MQVLAMSNKIRTPLLLMAGTELAVLFSAFYVAGLINSGNIETTEYSIGPIAMKSILLSTFAMIGLISMGLYHFHQRIYFSEVAPRLVVGLIIGFIAGEIVFYLIYGFAVDHRIVATAFVYSLVVLLGIRYFFVRTVDENRFRRRILIYGAGKRASRLTELRRRADRRGFAIAGQIEAPGDSLQVNESNLLRCNGNSIADHAIEFNADEIVMAMDERRGNLPLKELLEARLRGVAVIDLVEFLERETGKIRVDLVNPGWLIFSPGFRISRFRKFSKRIVDLFVSMVLVVVSWPVMLIVALAIKFEDGPAAPVLYRQLRVGQNGVNFEVLKFRSMSVDAEADGKAKWATENDSRITAVGTFLRKSRLDELPQVFNVLKGEMSIVGPRPERPEFVTELEVDIPYYAERHAVKPGVTGWAQLRYSYGASREDALEKLQYDLYYVKNQNLILDVMIILQTVEVVLWGKGAR